MKTAHAFGSFDRNGNLLRVASPRKEAWNTESVVIVKLEGLTHLQMQKMLDDSMELLQLALDYEARRIEFVCTARPSEKQIHDFARVQNLLREKVSELYEQQKAQHDSEVCHG